MRSSHRAAALSAAAVLLATAVSAMPAQGAVFRPHGPYVSHPGAGAGGADASVLDGAAGLGIFGFGSNTSLATRVADDFVVPDADGWDVTSIDAFAYQTNTPVGPPITSTITAANVRIWDGLPDDTPEGDGAKVVFGDTSTDRLVSGEFSGAYRVTETTLTNTARPIMRLGLDVATHLAPGTYWIDVQFAGDPALPGPWVVPNTIPGQMVTGNARQFASGVWSDLLDGTSQQGLPFDVHGTLGTALGTPAVNAATGTVTLPYAGIPAAVVTGYQCSLDAAPFAACPAGSTTLTGLAAGGHVFRVRSMTADDQDPTPAVIHLAVSATPPAPPTPPTTPPTIGDTTAPTLVLVAAGSQRAGKKVAATLACTEACSATVTGTVTIKGAKKPLSLTTRTLAVGPANVTASVPLSGKVAKAIKKAMRAKKKVTVVLTATAKDAAGNASAPVSAKVKVTAKG